MASLDTGGPIAFLLSQSGTVHLHLANAYLFVRAKVTNGNGTDIDANSAMGPFNNYLYSLFSQVEVFLKDMLVIPSINTYPFRAYIDTLLDYGIEAKETRRTSQL